MQKKQKRNKLKKADSFNMQHQLYVYWINRRKRGKANLKNNSRQYTCCFGAQLQVCILKKLFCG